jgi:L-seryl-tRNA(Ser) seleniumtransferase
MMSNPGFKHIPSMDILLSDPRVTVHAERLSRGEVKMLLQDIVDEFRRGIHSGSIVPDTDLGDRIIERLEERIQTGRLSTLRRVINATGVLLHTNLGRSILSRKAIDAMNRISEGYCTLEYDLDKGRRGSRYLHCEGLIKRVTGAEAALVVNNNAAAVTLVLNTFSEGKEAVVSRGELVEIGVSFRMPDIMAKSGACMVEVGTTNKTRISDYREAVSERTGILVKVHRSNFDISGFVDEATIEELAELGREKSIPLLYDQGSGVILDLEEFGVTGEQTVRENIDKGASIVCFSGDKILGGPQAGIIVGNREQVEQVRSNPLTRTYRVDKFTLAALEATMKLYLEPEMALKEIPVLRMLTTPIRDLLRRGEEIVGSLDEPNRSRVRLEEVASEMGGGSLPSISVPSIALSIDGGDLGVNALEKKAREWTPPIVGRIYKDQYLFDLRTVLEEDDTEIVSFLRGRL